MLMNDYERRWNNTKRRWVLLHREIMEQHIGRQLNSNEHIHHYNGLPRDNRIENLAIVTKAEHIRIHKPALKNRVCQKEGCLGKHHAKGLCKKHQMRQLRAQRKCC